MIRRGSDKTQISGLPGQSRVRTVAHAFTVCLAYIAFVFQLAASGTCGASLANAGAASFAGPFPICSAQADRQDGASGHGLPSAPSHHSDCPLCSIHCHAAILLPSGSEAAAAPVPAATPDAERPVGIASSNQRLCLGGSPRGPPLRA